MRKKLFGLIAFVSILLAGCLSDPIHDDLLNYLNKELKHAVQLERKAVNAYEAVSVPTVSNQAILDALTLEVIPTYKHLIEEVKAVEIETKELEKIHNLYVAGIEKQYAGFLKFVEGLEKDDPNLIDEGNVLLEEGRQKILEYTSKIGKLADDHNVKITKE